MQRIEQLKLELSKAIKESPEYIEYKRLEAIIDKDPNLKRSIDEINSTGIMEIKIKEKIKKGRSVDRIVFTVKDNEPRNYLRLYNKSEIDESVIWLDYIKVENKALLERLELKYSDMNFDSPIVKNIFHKAYDKTLNKDNRFVMIQDKKGKSNFALFNHIVSGELLTQELALTSQF